jgi:hypothetical protein
VAELKSAKAVVGHVVLTTASINMLDGVPMPLWQDRVVVGGTAEVLRLEMTRVEAVGLALQDVWHQVSQLLVRTEPICTTPQI